MSKFAFIEDVYFYDFVPKNILKWPMNINICKFLPQ